MMIDVIVDVVTEVTDGGKQETDLLIGGGVSLVYHPWWEKHGEEFQPQGHGRVMAYREGTLVREKGIRYKHSFRESLEEFLEKLKAVHGWTEKDESTGWTAEDWESGKVDAFGEPIAADE